MNKLERLLEHRTKTLGKIKELQKRVILLDHEIDYLKLKDVLLQSDHALLLESFEDGGPGVRPTSSGPVQNVSGYALPASGAPPKPKAKASGPICHSCSAENSLFRTTKSLNNGKLVQLVVCDSCKTEQIAQ